MTRIMHPLILLLVLALLFLPGFLQNGLSQDWMTPSYSTYTSYRTDGTYIYTSVTVSGSTSGTCPTQPAQFANECHNTHHTPKVYNTIGGVGGWETGSAVYWNSYLSMSNNQQIAATPGTEYTFASSAEVMCTFLGSAIYYAPQPDVYLKIVVATVQVTSFKQEYDCPVQPACVPGQIPSCPPSEVYDESGCYVGYVCEDIAYRFSQSSPFSCLDLAICDRTIDLPGPCN